MGKYLSTLVKYLKDSYVGVRDCPRFLDKLALASTRIGRVITYLVNVIGSRCFNRTLINPNAILFRDIMMKTQDGIFFCRRRTGDFSMCFASHEPLHRGFLDLTSGVFVDVGANIGKWTVSIAKKIGDRGRVIAIEAEPSNFAALCRNINANDLKNVIPIWAACSNVDGPLTLNYYPWSRHSSTIDPKHLLYGVSPNARSLDQVRTVQVQGRALDSLLNELGIKDIHLLKIDVEGAEMAVLEGAERTLAGGASLKRVIIETWSADPILFLAERDFKLSRIQGQDYVAERINHLS